MNITSIFEAPISLVRRGILRRWKPFSRRPRHLRSTRYLAAGGNLIAHCFAPPRSPSGALLIDGCKAHLAKMRCLLPSGSGAPNRQSYYSRAGLKLLFRKRDLKFRGPTFGGKLS